MNTSETQGALVTALLAAQQSFPTIAKTKEGQAGNRKFKYAPLETIKEKCDPILWKHGLVLTQGADGHILVTRLEHVSGEWRETRMPMNDVHASDQAYGIEFSYKRRYSYQSILGIVTEEDTDGNGSNSDSKLADMLIAIKEAADADALKAVFTECFNATKGNPKVQKQIIDAKDARKKELA